MAEKAERRRDWHINGGAKRAFQLLSKPSLHRDKEINADAVSS